MADAIPELIYKIASRGAIEAAAANGVFEGAPIDLQDGFIHFSTAGQLRETLRLHFAGQGDLLLLAVKTATLGEALVFEPSRGGQLFPHLYAPLDLATVEWQAPIAVAADGSVDLPEAVK